MSLVLLFHCLLLNMFRKLKHSSSAACDLLWIYFMGCIALVPYAGWSWNFSLHKDTTPPQPNHTVTPTNIEPEQYNTRNKSTISRKLLKMDVLTFETCRAVNNEIIKQVTSSWSIFIHFVKQRVHYGNCVLISISQLQVKIVRGGGGDISAEPLNDNSSFPTSQPSPNSHPSIRDPIRSAKPFQLPEYTKHVRCPAA